MKILLFGKNGQVGWELQRSLAPLGDVIALGSQESTDSTEISGFSGLCGDLTNRAGIAETVRRVAPQIIVNAAAYTAVDKAESEPALAYKINAEAPAVLAEEATKLGAWLVHYSSDYVFDGSGDYPRNEADLPNPLSVYGRSKLDGEKAVRRHKKHLIFRTSWVYATRGANFAKTMLRLARERDELNVISDQVGAPTSADLLADVTAHALRTLENQDSLAGLYHLVAHGKTNWHAYASLVIAEARKIEETREKSAQTIRVRAENIRAIRTAEYPTPAKRPLNSRLKTEKFERAFGLRLPPWEIGVRRMLKEVLER